MSDWIGCGRPGHSQGRRGGGVGIGTKQGRVVLCGLHQAGGSGGTEGGILFGGEPGDVGGSGIGQGTGGKLSSWQEDESSVGDVGVFVGSFELGSVLLMTGKPSRATSGILAGETASVAMFFVSVRAESCES